MHGDTWILLWEIWCWGCGIFAPIAWLTSSKKPMTADEAWALLPAMREQVFQLPDGSLAQLKTGWAPVDQARLPAQTPVSAAPARIVHGIQQA